MIGRIAPQQLTARWVGRGISVPAAAAAGIQLNETEPAKSNGAYGLAGRTGYGGFKLVLSHERRLSGQDAQQRIADPEESGPRSTLRQSWGMRKEVLSAAGIGGRRAGP